MTKVFKRILCYSLLLFSLFQLYKISQIVKQVLAYQPLVAEVLASESLDVSEDLVLAIIMTETKGKELDLMQASESLTGQTNTIMDSRESIRQGARLLAEHLNKVKALGLDDWVAVQAYNFGSQYIDFVAEHGGENSISLVKRYSREVVAPSLGNVTGQTYPYYHPVALFYGGTRLYQNGGNSYYAKEVRCNLYLLQLARLVMR